MHIPLSNFYLRLMNAKCIFSKSCRNFEARLIMKIQVVLHFEYIYIFINFRVRLSYSLVLFTFFQFGSNFKIKVKRTKV